MEWYYQILKENKSLETYHNLAVDHIDHWTGYASSGFKDLPDTPYLISFGLTLFAGIILLWLVWRLVSWPFRKRTPKTKRNKGGKNANSVAVSMPKGYEKWPRTIQNSYLKGQLFLIQQANNGVGEAQEAITALKETENSGTALHFLGKIRDEAQMAGNTNLQVKMMGLTSAMLYPTSIDAAKQTIESALAIAPTDSMLLLQNGDIALHQKKDKEAFQSYTKAHHHAKENKDVKAEVYALNVLGKMALHQRNITQAENYYSESLRLSETALKPKEVSQNWLKMLADNHSRMAKIQGIQGKFDEALNSLQNSLKILEQLRASAPNDLVINSNIATAHLNMGDMLHKQNKFGEAKVCFQKNIQLIQNLQKQHPNASILKRDYAIALSKLGQNDLKENDKASALNNYSMSLQSRQALSAENPDNSLFARDVAIGHERLAELHSIDPAQPDLSEKHYQDAYNIMASLAQKDQNVLWKEDMSRYLSHIAFLQFTAKKNDLAVSSIDQVISIKDNMLQKNPANVALSASQAGSYVLKSRMIDKTMVKDVLHQAQKLLKPFAEQNKLPKKHMALLTEVEKQLASLA